MSDTFEQDKLKDFTIVRNSIFKDYRLSAKAKGVACQLLSLPPTWDYSVRGVVTLFSDGEASIRSALSELEKFGYLRRERERDQGKLGKAKYIITDMLKSEKPNVENPLVENPQVGKPLVDNPPQLNTKESITDTSITELSNTYKSISSEFEELWSMYPKKHGKKRASELYRQTRVKHGVEFETVKSGMEAYIRWFNNQHKDIRYMKDGDTFFSQWSWQDDWSVSGRVDSTFAREADDILDGIL